MLKPIANLYIKDTDYRKTILFDMENLSLAMEDTEKVDGAKDIIFNYELLEELDPEQLNDFRYEGGSYSVNLHVKIFNEDTEHLRHIYMFTRPTQSMEYVKYRTTDGQDTYSVTEIHYGSHAGTDNKGDVIYIYVDFFSNFLEGEQVEECMQNRKEVRNLIPTSKNCKELDDKIEQINNERAKKNQRPLAYRYHIYDGTSILLDMNLDDLLWSPLPLEGSQVVDVSMFDMLSTHMNWNISNGKNDLLKAQKEERTIQIILNQKQANFLKEIMQVSDATWKKYQKIGIIKIV